MSKHITIGELRKAIARFNDDDHLVVEVDEGVRWDNPHDLEIETIILDYVPREDGSHLTEVRLII